MLGHYQSLTAQSDDERNRQQQQQQSDGSQLYFSQEYRDGTVCDVTGEARSTEVRFQCSPNTQDQILFLKETTTCKYLMVISTPRLCHHPDFKTAETAAYPIQCYQLLVRVSFKFSTRLLIFTAKDDDAWQKHDEERKASAASAPKQQQQHSPQIFGLHLDEHDIPAAHAQQQQQQQQPQGGIPIELLQQLQQQLPQIIEQQQQQQQQQEKQQPQQELSRKKKVESAAKAKEPVDSEKYIIYHHLSY